MTRDFAERLAIDGGAEPLFARETTGNPNLDDVLGGGFPANSINIVMGQPGTGKTVLAEQLVFHHARTNGDRPIVYITTLSEPMTKVVSYVQRFAFFDPAKLGTSIVYEDLGGPISRDGPEALRDWIKGAIKTLSPRIIVVDSFRALHDLASSPSKMRRLIADLASIFAAYETTVFLLGEYTRADIDRFPEFAVADAIVELARQPLTTRDERFLRVIKLRGSSYREGQHAFRITADGIDLYPRLVSPGLPPEYNVVHERVPSGVEGLDAMLDGGLWRGSTTLVVGPTGAGKTTLGLQFVREGMRRREPTLMVHFQENPVQIRRAMKALGVQIDGPDAEHLDFIYSSPVELQIDSIIGSIFDQVRRRGVRRVVIDAVGDLAIAASDARRMHDYLYALAQYFVVHGVTSLLMLEPGKSDVGADEHEQRLSYLSDNVLRLGYSGETETRRSIRVVKSRNSAHDHRVRAVEIDRDGLRVL
jgi:circadian clock protein KaiC